MAPQGTNETRWAEALGPVVSKLLAERGLTQKDLARSIKMDPATISRVIYGAHMPTLDQVAWIADALGVTRRSILGRMGYLEPDGVSTLDLDTLPPLARQMVLAAVRTALEPDE